MTRGCGVFEITGLMAAGVCVVAALAMAVVGVGSAWYGEPAGGHLVVSFVALLMAAQCYWIAKGGVR